MSEDNYGHLKFETEDKQVLSRLRDMGEMLKSLKTKQLEAEAALDAAKKEYEHYANVILPSEMHAVGLDSITLTSGGMIKMKRNFYCQPNKNAEDRAKMAEWLRKNGGGHIIKNNATVASEDIDKLIAEDIAFIENTEINTNSLKAFLRDGIGVTTGVQQFEIDDIPACMHFREVQTVELEMPK
jgi:hypothetical protein